MTRWQGSGRDDEQERGGAGFSGAIQRFFRSDNPLDAAIPIFRIFRITVRIHIFFVLYIAIELAVASSQGNLVHRGISLSLLFMIVLLHEFGHCFACRWVGGQADDVVLWPLGGLAMCRPPHNWWASLVTTVGGPMVNVILVPISAAVVWLTWERVEWGTFVFNPFWGTLPITYATSWVGSAAWWFYFVNLALLLFNVLLPIFPMDGGRIVQELLWKRMGFVRSMKIAVNVGLVGAAALGFLALSTGQHMLFAIALFGGVTCVVQRQKLRYMEVRPAQDDDPYGLFKGPAGQSVLPDAWPDTDEPGPTPRSTAREAARREKEMQAAAAHQAELDRILAKIAKTGMASLSGAERRFLEQDTQRRRAT